MDESRIKLLALNMKNTIFNTINSFPLTPDQFELTIAYLVQYMMYEETIRWLTFNKNYSFEEILHHLLELTYQKTIQFHKLARESMN